jgi:hemerythrin-like domain-containing protein
MSEMLRRLRQDHINLQKLLFILERQIVAFDHREGPDWDIIEGAIDYLLTYPDLRHHPAEDRILRRLQAKDPTAAAPFRDLDAGHREQSAALRRIAAATRQVLQDASMERQGYVGLLFDFVAAQRDPQGGGRFLSGGRAEFGRCGSQPKPGSRPRAGVGRRHQCQRSNGSADTA